MLAKKDGKIIIVDESQENSESPNEMVIERNIPVVFDDDVIEQPVHSSRSIAEIMFSKTSAFVLANFFLIGTFFAIIFSPTTVVVLSGVSLIARMGYSILKTRKYHNTNQQADKINRDLAIEVQLARKEFSSQQTYITALNSICMTVQGASAALLAYYTKKRREKFKKKTRLGII